MVKVELDYNVVAQISVKREVEVKHDSGVRNSFVSYSNSSMSEQKSLPLMFDVR
jgi:hypothetical protein